MLIAVLPDCAGALGIVGTNRSLWWAAELAAFLLFVAALLATLLVNVPIDYQINQWTVATLPSHWEAVRDRWEFYHTFRTLASLAGVGCALASALSRTGVPTES